MAAGTGEGEPRQGRVGQPIDDRLVASVLVDHPHVIDTIALPEPPQSPQPTSMNMSSCQGSRLTTEEFGGTVSIRNGLRCAPPLLPFPASSIAQTSDPVGCVGQRGTRVHDSGGVQFRSGRLSGT